MFQFNRQLMRFNDKLYIVKKTINGERISDLELAKEYYEADQEKILDRVKNYLDTNRDKINEQRRERYKLKKLSVNKVENTEPDSD